MSDIVKRFYSPLEKLGIKKHKCNQDEVDYVDRFDTIEQLKKYVDEADFNITRISIKFHTSRGLSVLFLILAISSFSFAWFVPTILFLSSGVSYVISNHLDTALFIWKAQKGVCYCSREELLGNQKEEQLKTMFR